MESSDELKRFGLTIPAPAGLRERGPADGVRLNLEKILENSGTLINCYRSNETVQLMAEDAGEEMPGVKQAPHVPLHNAFALYIKGDDDYYFDDSGFKKFRGTAQQQWAGYKSADGHQSADHTNYMNRRLTKGPLTRMELYEPILVKFDDSIESQCIVTSVRERILTWRGRKFGTIKAESTCILHTDGLLLRTHYARELRKLDDIDRVRDALDSWLKDIKLKNMI
jgi:hypothetical protein